MVECITKKLVILLYLLAIHDALGLEVVVNPYRDLDYEKINVYEIEMKYEPQDDKGGDQISTWTEEIEEIFNYLNYMENKQKGNCE